MAFERGSTWARFDTAADAITGRHKILSLAISVGATAATRVAPVSLKDGSGNVIGNYTGIAETTTVLDLGGWWVDGLELDALPTGAEVTAFFA